MSLIRQVALRLKEMREARGWSQRELSDRAGISREYLARLEGARHDPTLGTLEKLAKALGVTVKKLL